MLCKEKENSFKFRLFFSIYQGRLSKNSCAANYASCKMIDFLCICAPTVRQIFVFVLVKCDSRFYHERIANFLDVFVQASNSEALATFVIRKLRIAV